MRLFQKKMMNLVQRFLERLIDEAGLRAQEYQINVAILGDSQPDVYFISPQKQTLEMIGEYITSLYENVFELEELFNQFEYLIVNEVSSDADIPEKYFLKIPEYVANKLWDALALNPKAVIREMRSQGAVITSEKNVKNIKCNFVQSHSSYSLIQVMMLADKACAYTRRVIQASSTELKCNELDVKRFQNRIKWIDDIRRYIKRYEHPLEYKDSYEEYQDTLDVTSKSGVGNCEEMAFHALDYLACKTNLFAEIYFIEGKIEDDGDHVFVVVNRSRDSVPNDPSTWGDAAVICDPWAEKVYPASGYLAELKNFYVHDSENENCVEDFDPYKHDLFPDEEYTTDTLRSARAWKDIYNLQVKFDAYIEEILSHINRFQLAFNRYALSLASICDKANVITFIQNQTTSLYRCKMMMHEASRSIQNIDVNANYFAVRKKMTRDLQNIKIMILKAINFQEGKYEDVFKLAHNPHSRKKRAVKNSIKYLIEDLSQQLRDTIPTTSQRAIRREKLVGQYGHYQVSATSEGCYIQKHGEAPRLLEQVGLNLFMNEETMFEFVRDDEGYPKELIIGTDDEVKEVYPFVSPQIFEKTLVSSSLVTCSS